MLPGEEALESSLLPDELQSSGLTGAATRPANSAISDPQISQMSQIKAQPAFRLCMSLNASGCHCHLPVACCFRPIDVMPCPTTLYDAI